MRSDLVVMSVEYNVHIFTSCPQISTAVSVKKVFDLLALQNKIKLILKFIYVSPGILTGLEASKAGTGVRIWIWL
jgi:hypothetical protein